MNTKSKVTFSVDLNKDPDEIFEEIKLRIERELKRKGSGDKTSAFLAKVMSPNKSFFLPSKPKELSPCINRFVKAFKRLIRVITI